MRAALERAAYLKMGTRAAAVQEMAGVLAAEVVGAKESLLVRAGTKRDFNHTPQYINEYIIKRGIFQPLSKPDPERAPYLHDGGVQFLNESPPATMPPGPALE